MGGKLSCALDLWGVDSSYFTAGLEVDAATRMVVNAAPILRWTIGKTLARVQEYAVKRHWEMYLISAGVVPRA